MLAIPVVARLAVVAIPVDNKVFCVILSAVAKCPQIEIGGHHYLFLFFLFPPEAVPLPMHTDTHLSPMHRQTHCANAHRHTTCPRKQTKVLPAHAHRHKHTLLAHTCTHLARAHSHERTHFAQTQTQTPCPRTDKHTYTWLGWYHGVAGYLGK